MHPELIKIPVMLSGNHRLWLSLKDEPALSSQMEVLLNL